MPENNPVIDDDEFDDYVLEDGFATEYEYTITDAVFRTNAEYNAGQTLRLDFDGSAIIDGIAVDMELHYPCGKDWEAGDGGKRAVSTQEGRPTRAFNKNSSVGRLVAAAVEAIGGPEKMRELGRAREAGTWIGTRWHMVRNTSSFKNKEGEEVEWSVMLPDRYLGKVGDGPVTAASSSPSPAANGHGTAPLTKVMEVKLKNLAKKCATHDEFIEAGLELANGDVDIENMVIDAGQYAAWKE